MPAANTVASTVPNMNSRFILCPPSEAGRASPANSRDVLSARHSSAHAADDRSKEAGKSHVFVLSRLLSAYRIDTRVLSGRDDRSRDWSHLGAATSGGSYNRQSWRGGDEADKSRPLRLTNVPSCRSFALLA